MKVVRAKHAGACYGVQRALDMAYAAILDGGETYTLGPLIHNPQVVSSLEAQGVRVAESVADVPSGAVVIRSHGVTPQVRREVDARGLEAIDATCPHVARAQKAAADLARSCGQVVVVGEAGHPRWRAWWLARARPADRCAWSPRVRTCPRGWPRRWAWWCRPRRRARRSTDVVAALAARGIAPEVKNTICFATRQRQEAAAELAAQVDAIVVIGGRNSSNTTRLADICAAACARTHHVEAPGELDPAWFEGCATVGVTLSQSEEHIQAVVERLGGAVGGGLWKQPVERPGPFV